MKLYIERRELTIVDQLDHSRCNLSYLFYQVVYIRRRHVW